MKAISILIIACAIAVSAFAASGNAEEGVRRKFPPKVKLQRQRATPHRRCRGIDTVKTDSGKCLKWIYG